MAMDIVPDGSAGLRSGRPPQDQYTIGAPRRAILTFALQKCSETRQKRGLLKSGTALFLKNMARSKKMARFFPKTVRKKRVKK